MYTTKSTDYFINILSSKYHNSKTLEPFEPLLESISFVDPIVDKPYHSHIHPSFEIIIPDDHIYKCYLNDKFVSVNPDQFILIQPGDVHQDILTVGMKFAAITFIIKDSQLLHSNRNLFKNDVQPDQRISTFSNDKLTEEIYRLLISIKSYENIYSCYLLNNIFQALFWRILNGFPKNLLIPTLITSNKNEEFKHLLLNYFEKNLHHSKQLADIAKDLGMSESSLAHKSKQLLGVTPAKAFMNHKMKKALNMLQYSHLSLQEISNDLGFKDQFHFSKNFKKYFGKAPSKIKN